jgi:hypothetical protein
MALQALQMSKERHLEPLIDMPGSMEASTVMALYMGQSWSSMIGSSRKQPPYGWILSLADVHGSGTASSFALKALLLARSGHQIGKNDMSVASYRMYNSALATVAQQCSRNKDTVGDDTMAAVLLLALYEVCELKHSW